MDTTELRLENGSRLITDLTAAVGDFCRGKGDGLVNVFAPHATAGLALMETGSGSEHDLDELLSRLLPIGEAYHHRHGSPGHGRDHVLPAVISASLSIPVVNGQPALGTWQSIVLVDTNGDNPSRTVRLSFLAG